MVGQGPSARRPLAAGEPLASPGGCAPRRAATLLRRTLLAALLGAAATGLGGCTTLGYYAQAVSGHLDIVSRRQPIDRLLAAEATDPALRERLRSALAARDFASRELGLPDNGSYRSYADIERRYVTWNVIATEEFSVAARQWCFPIAGCVPYRGYYSEAEAEAFAAGLAGQRLDVFVNPATAYSTLGWFDDPLLNTMLAWHDTRLAGVIFHELAHQQVWVKDDAAFNESFAVFVQDEGVRRWLQATATPEDLAAYAERIERRRAFAALLRATRAELATLYASDAGAEAMRTAKESAFARLRAGYADLKRRWGGYGGYDNWFDRPLNNARLALVATYNDHVAGFAGLFERAHRDFPAFYAAVAELGALQPAARAARLAELGGG